MEVASAVVSALIAAVVALASYLEWRRRELRRDEVFAWGNRAIEAMQTLTLICVLDPNRHPSVQFEEQADRLVFDTSILIEQGRMFFKNIVRDAFGSEKPKAYRGYRPEILDHLVVAHQAACTYRSLHNVDRRKLGEVVTIRLRRFVSAMQAEVGRGRTASEDTTVAGHGINLRLLMDELSISTSANRPHF